MKKIVLDTSALISISEKCLVKIFSALAEKEKIKFYIPDHVYREAVLTPIEIKRFEFNAIRIRELINEGVIIVQKEDSELRSIADKLHSIIGNIFSFNGSTIELVHRGEIQALALLKYLDAKILAIDERTTRMLVEEPQNLANFLKKRHEEESIKVNDAALKQLAEFLGELTIVRSVELLSFAYEKNCFNDELPHTKEALEAALFALKYAGCAISAHEILSYLNSVEE